MIPYSYKARTVVKGVLWALIAACVMLGVLLYLATLPAYASPPVRGEHKVTICHATPPDTAADGWVSIEVDVASVGYQHSGHQDQHAADIIPPYHYDDVSYPGKGDQSILANGCVKPETPPPTTPPPTTPPPTTPPPTTPPPTVVPPTVPPTVPPVTHPFIPPMNGVPHSVEPTLPVSSGGLAYTGDYTGLIAGIGLLLVVLGFFCLHPVKLFGRSRRGGRRS